MATTPTENTSPLMMPIVNVPLTTVMSACANNIFTSVCIYIWRVPMRAEYTEYVALANTGAT